MCICTEQHRGVVEVEYRGIDQVTFVKCIPEFFAVGHGGTVRHISTALYSKLFSIALRRGTVQCCTCQLVSVRHGGQLVVIYLLLVHAAPPWILPLVQLSAFGEERKGERCERKEEERELIEERYIMVHYSIAHHGTVQHSTSWSSIAPHIMVQYR
jgi:hypothetical protein